MGVLLDSLFQNESGGRNVANTTQGTSSGQAQGYFQITTGTWDEFGGRKYAPDPMHATYAQQAEIASKIPLKRWDESTVGKMTATGRPLNVNQTLGENLAANGESAAAQPRVSGPVEAAGGGQGSDVGATQLYGPPPVTAAPAEPAPLSVAADLSTLQKNDPWSSLATGLAASVGKGGGSTEASNLPQLPDINLDTPTAIPKAPATPEVGGDLSALGDIFKVGDFGQAQALNVDRAGQSVRRRQYG